MSRSLKKGPNVDERILKKIEKIEKGSATIIKIWNRAAAISPEMVGYIFGVHNGKEHIPVLISEEMVGHKLGEFSETTKFGRHGGKIQKDQETAQKQKEVQQAKE